MIYGAIYIGRYARNRRHPHKGLAKNIYSTKKLATSLVSSSDSGVIALGSAVGAYSPDNGGGLLLTDMKYTTTALPPCAPSDSHRGNKPTSPQSSCRRRN